MSGRTSQRCSSSGSLALIDVDMHGCEHAIIILFLYYCVRARFVDSNQQWVHRNLHYMTFHHIDAIGDSVDAIIHSPTHYETDPKRSGWGASSAKY